MPIPSLLDPSTPTSSNAGDWRAALLTALGAPLSQANLQALHWWHVSEGTNLATNNPLAITDPNNRWPHAGVIASNGGNPVYAFPDQATGVAATAAFLKGSNYDGVRAAFQTNPDGVAGLRAVFDAINRSPWCRGCQDGHYPVALFQHLFGVNFGDTLPADPGAADAGGGGGGGGGGGSSGAWPEDAATSPADAAKAACLLGFGPFTLPGSVPNIPFICLFQKSWGWAIVGAGALAAGGVLVLIGAHMAAERPVPQVLTALPVGRLPMNPSRFRG